MLKIGIVGLPNVGKSTLFNALIKKSVANVANYPFCTIDPNIGIVEVPDERLNSIAKIFNAEKIVPAVIEFYDIAGLVKGSSKGEGLGNQFLSHIKEVDAIVHVVRFFEDANIHHISGSIDPMRDIEIVNSELILKDLETLSRQEKPKKTLSKDELIFFETVEFLIEKLNTGLPASACFLNEQQKNSIKKLNLLSIKPVLFVFNVSEEQITNANLLEKEIKKLFSSVNNFLQNSHFRYIYICAKLESEIASLSPQEQNDYLLQYNIQESGFSRLAREGYKLLNLISYLTGGEKEARAWTITKGTRAPQAAGAIHSDFEKHFIKAEIVPFETFVKFHGWQGCREAGKIIIAGKEYVMQDGDVVDFKVGV